MIDPDQDYNELAAERDTLKATIYAAIHEIENRDGTYALATLKGQVTSEHPLEAQLAKVTAERNSNKAMINVAYLAGYYQSECGLPEHDHVSPEVEKVLGRAYRMALKEAEKLIREQQDRCEEQTQKLGGIVGRENDWHRWNGGDMSLGTAAATIRATPTPADLVERVMKEGE